MNIFSRVVSLADNDNLGFADVDGKYICLNPEISPHTINTHRNTANIFNILSNLWKS
jgi:hypothetical protein